MPGPNKLNPKVDSCVEQVMAGWSKDPKSMPEGMMTPEDKKSRAIAICRASLKMQEIETEQERIALEGKGPALIAVAITSKPHLDQRTPDDPKSKRIEIVEHEGRKLVKIPLFKKALYKHDKGPLSFSDAFINRMVENHKNKVTGRPVYLDFRHGDQYGTLAHLDSEDGGWLQMGQDNWLYAYGLPVVDNIEQMVKQWPHASVEFAPNYESNFVQKLSTDDLSEINPEDLVEMEDIMPKKLTLGTKVITLEGEVQDGQVTEIETAYNEMVSKITQLEAKVIELSPKPAPQLPEEYRVRLEALEIENRRLSAEKHAEKVTNVIEKARNYRDSRGYGHSKVMLELAEAGLKLSAYEADGTTIKLEDGGKIGDVVAFYGNIIKTMLEKVPGTVPMQGATVGDQVRLEATGFTSDHYTAEELSKAQEDFWK